MTGRSEVLPMIMLTFGFIRWVYWSLNSFLNHKSTQRIGYFKLNVGRENLSAKNFVNSSVAKTIYTMQKIRVHDKEFELFIPGDQIQKVVSEMADKINRDLEGKEVIFMGILNGAFMFASDLIRQIRLDCQMTFLKLASYAGTSSMGTVKRLIGINEDIRDKTVVILEDIVDTGITLEDIIKQLRGYEPGEIRVATLLLKPDAYIKEIPLDYVGMEIPNDFVVGYGLDYEGHARNLSDIYRVVLP
jgi:hypoxanthine phosphoribosyltransferase